MLKFLFVCVFGTILSACFLSFGFWLSDFAEAGWPWHDMGANVKASIYYGFTIGVLSILVLPISLAFKAFPKGGDFLGYFPIIFICLCIFAATLNEQLSLKEWWWQLHLGLILIITFYVLFLNWADKILFNREARGA